jgi:S-adenosylmethionine:tRNA-ribosyltransferase-isomerase (queuine synthetase)
VFNDTRVIRARLFGHKESGGQIEVLIERIVDARHAVAQIRASKSPKPGSRILLEDASSWSSAAAAANRTSSSRWNWPARAICGA